MKSFYFVFFAGFVLTVCAANCGCTRQDPSIVAPPSTAASVAPAPAVSVAPEEPVVATAATSVSGSEEDAGNGEEEPWALMPTMAYGPDSDCSGIITAQFTNKKGFLRKGNAALGSKLQNGAFIPTLYFLDSQGAEGCAAGNPDLVVETWNGHNWQ